MNFADRLTERILALRSPSVVGLDPRVSWLPEELLARHRKERGATLDAAADAVYEFCVAILDLCAGQVPGVKFQSAFFERLGWQGMRVLRFLLDEAAGRGLIVIMDAKRADIRSTAIAYAEAFLGTTEINGYSHRAFPADALTIHPYLGADGVLPFLEVAAPRGHGVFVLVRTSNPSAAEVQGELSSEHAVVRKVAELVEAWGSSFVGNCGYSALGAVVGATFPKDLDILRTVMPHTLFLLPGYGAQGAKASDLSRAFDSRGLGAVVNSSRGITFAFREKDGRRKDGDWKTHIAAAIDQMNAELGEASGLR